MATKPQNAAGKYTDLSQIPIGIDVKNQLFSGLGFSGVGDGYQYLAPPDPNAPYYDQPVGYQPFRSASPWWDQEAGGVNEGGLPVATGAVSPEAAAALKDYTFDWQPSGKRNEGLLTAYGPQGEQIGRYWQQDPSTLQTLREYAGMLTSAAGVLFPGAAPALLGELGLGSLGTSAVMGGLGSAISGGDLKDVLKGAALGGLGSLAAPYIGEFAKSAGEAVGGGALGEAARGAVTGGFKSGIGSLVSGGGLEGVLPGVLGGAATPLASSIVSPFGLPEPVTNIATKVLAAEMLGKDTEKTLINAALGEIMNLGRTDPNEEALRAAYGPAGQASRKLDLLPAMESARPVGEDLSGIDWASIYAEPSVIPGYMDPDGYYVHETPIVPEPQADHPVQDYGVGAITPENLRGMDNAYQQAWDNGGFTSPWQTVGSDRVYVFDDGSSIGLNTETGETYGLEADQTQRMIDAGLLNTEQSGYTTAIGATPSPAPAPAPAPAAAPVAPPAAQTPPPAAAKSGTDLGALMAIMGAMNAGQAQSQQRDTYQLANVEPGVKSALELIEQMYGRG